MLSPDIWLMLWVANSYSYNGIRVPGTVSSSSSSSSSSLLMLLSLLLLLLLLLLLSSSLLLLLLLCRYFYCVWTPYSVPRRQSLISSLRHVSQSIIVTS